MSELYQRKVNKARQSLNEAERVRSIVKSLRDNSLKHQLAMNSKVDRGDCLGQFYIQKPRYKLNWRHKPAFVIKFT